MKGFSKIIKCQRYRSTIFLFCIILLLIFLQLLRILYIKCVTGFPKVDVKQFFETSFHNKKVEILFWTTYFGRKGLNAGFYSLDYDEDCLKDCQISFDRKKLKLANAIIFHAPTPLDLSKKDLPNWRDMKQVWVVLNQESPQTFFRNDLESFNGVFNWTMTYRYDSDVFHPYGRIVPLKGPDLEKISSNIRTLVQRKTKLVTCTISRCISKSKREVLISQLRKHGVSVDIYGNCGNLKTSNACPQGTSRQRCPDQTFFNDIAEQYKFYLAFENSICIDYVTEKLFRALELGMVPVVYGGANYSRFAPVGSYISFNTTEDLAKLLLQIDKNTTMYTQYFDWRKTSEVLKRVGWCTLCEKVRSLLNGDIPPKVIKNLKHWWETGPVISPPANRFNNQNIISSYPACLTPNIQH